jgi:TolA-binding protein
MSRTRAPSWIEPEDLSVRARRDSLSEVEREAFARAVTASQMLAVAHRVGTDFDRIGVARSGDDELVSRVADAAMKISRAPNRAAFRRQRLFFVLAAALTLAGSAAAWRGAFLRRAPSVQSASSHASSVAANAPSLAPPAAVLAAPSPDGVRTPPSDSAIVSSSAPDPAHAAEPVSHAVSDAAGLFREATAARHAADFGRARGLYLRLESEFPASPEAQLAHVSLGKVLLSMGRASEAEQQFAVYLRADGGLTEEALVGRAQSLARLGRGDDERRVWETLVREFPTSVYAAQARGRLSSLAESRP